MLIRQNPLFNSVYGAKFNTKYCLKHADASNIQNTKQLSSVNNDEHTTLSIDNSSINANSAQNVLDVAQKSIDKHISQYRNFIGKNIDIADSRHNSSNENELMSDSKRDELYKNYIQDAYYLYAALALAKVEIKSVELEYVNAAFLQFHKSATELIEKEHIQFDI